MLKLLLYIYIQYMVQTHQEYRSMCMCPGDNYIMTICHNMCDIVAYTRTSAIYIERHTIYKQIYVINIWNHDKTKPKQNIVDEEGL